MIESVLEDIKQYVYEHANIEACGLLSVKKGRIKWTPCENKAENPKNDFIIDPFMGIGSTGLACGNLDRKFIGVEIDNKYFEIAKNRIKNNNIKDTLF